MSERWLEVRTKLGPVSSREALLMSERWLEVSERREVFGHHEADE